MTSAGIAIERPKAGDWPGPAPMPDCLPALLAGYHDGTSESAYPRGWPSVAWRVGRWLRAEGYPEPTFFAMARRRDCWRAGAAGWNVTLHHDSIRIGGQMATVLRFVARGGCVRVPA